MTFLRKNWALLPVYGLLFWVLAEQSQIEKSNSVNQKSNDIILDASLEGIENRVSKLETKVAALPTIIKDSDRTAYLGPSSTGFTTARGDFASYLITLEDMAPYGNGYKIILGIANASAIPIKNLKLKIRWNRKFDSKKDDYLEWEKLFKETESTVLDFINPGVKAKSVIVLSPCEKAETEDIRVEIDESNLIAQYPSMR